MNFFGKFLFYLVFRKFVFKKVAKVASSTSNHRSFVFAKNIWLYLL